MSKYMMDQDDDGKWFIFDNEDCYCAAGPFDSEFTASEEQLRLESLDEQSN